MSTINIYFETYNLDKYSIEVDPYQSFSSVKSSIIDKAHQVNLSAESDLPLLFFKTTGMGFQLYEVRDVEEVELPSEIHVVIKVQNVAQLITSYPGVGSESNRIRIGRRVSSVS